MKVTNAMSSSADTLSQRDSDRRTVGGKGVLKDANASKSYRATDRAPMKRHRYRLILSHPRTLLM